MPNHATTKRSNDVSLISGITGPRGGRQVGGEMKAPRVSDDDLERFIPVFESAFAMPDDFERWLLLRALLDLKDARDQLKTHQEMRALYNKEPE